MTETPARSDRELRVYPALGAWREWRRSHTQPVQGYPHSTAEGRMASDGEAALIRGQGLKLEQPPEDVYVVEDFLAHVASEGQRQAIEAKFGGDGMSDAHCARYLGYDTKSSFQRVLWRAYDQLDGMLYQAHRARVELTSDNPIR